jgi:hypothetical protein
VLPTLFLINIFRKCYQHFFHRVLPIIFRSVAYIFSLTFSESVANIFPLRQHFQKFANISFVNICRNVGQHFSPFFYFFQHFSENVTTFKKCQHFTKCCNIFLEMLIFLPSSTSSVHWCSAALDAVAGPRRGRAAPRPAGRGRRGRAAPRPLVRARRRRAAGKLLLRAPARDRRPHARGRDTSAGGARAWKPRRTATSRAGQRRRDRAGRSGAAGGGATMHSGGACEVFSWLGFQHVGLCGPSWAAMGL